MPDLVKTYQDLLTERDSLEKTLPALQAAQDTATLAYTNAYERYLSLTRVLKDMAEHVAEVKAVVKNPIPVDPLPVVK